MSQSQEEHHHEDRGEGSHDCRGRPSIRQVLIYSSSALFLLCLYRVFLALSLYFCCICKSKRFVFFPLFLFYSCYLSAFSLQLFVNLISFTWSTLATSVTLLLTLLLTDTVWTASGCPTTAQDSLTLPPPPSRYPPPALLVPYLVSYPIPCLHYPPLLPLSVTLNFHTCLPTIHPTQSPPHPHPPHCRCYPTFAVPSLAVWRCT